MNLAKMLAKEAKERWWSNSKTRLNGFTEVKNINIDRDIT